MDLRPGNAITGKMQWSSLVSGWSVRSIEGAWNPARTQLILRDIKMLEDRPELGWSFCTVDQYNLSVQGSIMTGTYRSAACDDQATLHLKRMNEGTARLDSSSVTEEEPSPSSFSCLGATLGRSVHSWILAILFLFTRRRC